MTAVPVYARALWGYPWRSAKVREGVLRKIDFCCFIALKGDCSSLKKWPAEGCWNDTACCALARSPQRGSESRQTRWPPPPPYEPLSRAQPFTESPHLPHKHTLRNDIHKWIHTCAEWALSASCSPCFVSASSWWDVRITLPALRGRDVTDFTPTRVMTHSSLTTLQAPSQRVAGTNLTAATAHYLIKRTVLGPAV